jgi:sulfur relay (sulfurtransferase) complex TusBCD TusD component (DsrE family)
MNEIMTKYLIALTILLGISVNGYSQIVSSCENVTAFDKSRNPDLAIVIYSGDAETVWNALRLATYAQSKNDSVVIFVVGKGMDAYMHDTTQFNINELNIKFLSNGGDIYTCATCAKLRGTEEVKSCTITSLADLYIIIKRSKKVLTF